MCHSLYYYIGFKNLITMITSSGPVSYLPWALIWWMISQMSTKTWKRMNAPLPYRIRFRKSSGSAKALQAFGPLRNVYNLALFISPGIVFPKLYTKLPFSPYHHHYHDILWKSSECQEWSEKSVKAGRHLCKEGGRWGERLG